MAYELKDPLRKEDTLTVVTKDPTYYFVPSNPWIAVGWRKRAEIAADLAPTMAKKKINFIPMAAERLHPDENRIERVDGQPVTCDCRVVATGPELAFDEVPGLGLLGGFSQSVCLRCTENRLHHLLPLRSPDRSPRTASWPDGQMPAPPFSVRPGDGGCCHPDWGSER